VLETLTADATEKTNGKTSTIVRRHVTSFDTGRIKPAEGLVSAGPKETGSAYRLTAFVEGRAYGEDLVRLKLGGDPVDLDQRRVDALADHLAEIHREKNVDPGLYGAGLRTLLGQEIMGLLDSYPQPEGIFNGPLLEQLEHRCLKWRWQLKGRTQRLSRIHGDFNPWAVLFRDNVDFSVLNHTPGQWGEPAQDVASLTMNYLLAALQATGDARMALLSLFRRFWKRYLEKTGDLEILEVAPLFLVHQGLALAGPVGDLGLNVKPRLGLFSFMFQVLDAPRFDPSRVEDLLKEI
jgi:aminoglycoside phosphotransferase (APT) family kinase protein